MSLVILRGGTGEKAVGWEESIFCVKHLAAASRWFVALTRVRDASLRNQV